MSLPQGATELERVADVIGLPCGRRREVCAVAFQGRVACFDLATATSSGRRDLSSLERPRRRRALCLRERRPRRGLALDNDRRASLWKQDKLADRNLSAPLALGGGVVVGDLQGYVHLLSRDRRRVRRALATDGRPIAYRPVASASGFLVQTRRNAASAGDALAQARSSAAVGSFVK